MSKKPLLCLLMLVFGLQGLLCLNPVRAQLQPIAAPPQDNRLIDDQLAAEFFRNRDWENAKILYLKLYEKHRAQYYYNNYFECLIQLKQLDEAERSAKRELRNQRNVQNKVDYGYVLKLKGEDKKSQQIFDELLQEMPADRNVIHLTANAFRVRNLDDYALEAYTKGSLLPGVGYGFWLERSYLYQLTGNYNAMMEAYLAAMQANPEQTDLIKSRIQAMMMMDVDNSMAALVREKILDKAQKEPDKILYSDLLIWFALQEKDFEMAMIQARALDRRLGDQDQRIIELAEISLSNGQYKVAHDGFQYLVKKGRSSAFYFNALSGDITARYHIENEKPVPSIELMAVVADDIENFFEEVGFNRQTFSLALIRASILGYNLKQPLQADELLEKTLALGLMPNETAEAKMLKADLLLFQDEVWEATLIYSQIDKAMKNEPSGHEARFRNARLRYFIGEFAWAQSQLDILKTATSKLIANDALQLSLVIRDNLIDDTTGLSLKAFAKADLRLWQKRDAEALFLLDSLAENNKSLSIQPLILLKKAELSTQKQEFSLADSLLTELFTRFGDHYLADDALFRCAQINESHLQNTERARKCYEIVFNQYPASIFAAQARQKYRFLRGDK
ncbi:MAG: hypothetical protein IT219_08245 [Bacteroidales bacterium]|nr:hypothetical protein [Bacteroidales bacterium]